jgi:hypothetical protein
MPGSTMIWQLRQCGVPLIVTRHSKQIPIPHSGPRGSPATDVRHACPAIVIATATVAPSGTDTAEPFTISVTSLDTSNFLENTRWQVRIGRNLRDRPANEIH